MDQRQLGGLLLVGLVFIGVRIAFAGDLGGVGSIVAFVAWGAVALLGVLGTVRRAVRRRRDDRASDEVRKVE